MADLPLTAQGVRGGADISPDGLYRYTLWRRWGAGPIACFVMLNPSTADATEDDPTIRKCMGFARRWGMGGIRVANLFAYRTPYPRELAQAHARGIDVVGPGNDVILRAHMETAARFVVAWGPAASAGAAVRRMMAVRAAAVIEQAEQAAAELHCLGRAADGSPRHPLMLRYATEIEPWPTPIGGARG